jgi:hypothetical protein
MTEKTTAPAPATAATATVATAATSAAPPAGQALPARLIGVLFAPRATYAGLAARPRWLGALAVVALTFAVSSGAFLSTEVGKNAMLDQQVRQAESFSGRPMTDAQRQRLESMLPYAPYFAALSLVTLPLAAVILAGIAVGVFNAILGADGTFAQTFAVVVHSGVIMMLAQLFTLPLDYVRESMTSPTSVAVFLPFLDEGSFPARLLGVVDLFQIWWIVSLAIGFGVLYRKRTAPIAAVMLSLYTAIALVIAALKSAA